jgi:hypothetical protein
MVLAHPRLTAHCDGRPFLTTAGIRNVGDFFSQHYVDQLLEKDLEELLDRRRAKHPTKDDSGRTNGVGSGCTRHSKKFRSPAFALVSGASIPPPPHLSR